MAVAATPPLPELAKPVLALAAAIRTALGDDGAALSVDRALASLAIRRHRVGPLLHAAATRMGTTLDADTALRLANHVKANARRTMIAALAQGRIVRLLAQAEIPSLIFKGLPMARRLYGDAALRHCGDVDVLVPPSQFRAAARVLYTAGFAPDHARLSPRGEMSGPAARMLRDITLRDRTTGQRIELHQRLFHMPSWGPSTAADDTGFRPRRPSRDGEIAAPDIGPALALYLLQHGAMCGWHRLKWLADLSLLLPRLEPAEATALADLAENSGMAVSIKASLMLVQGLFDCPLPAAAEAWLAERAGVRGIGRRLAFYASQLNTPSDTVAGPTNSRIQALKATLLMTERPAQRLAVLAYGPASSGLRFLEKSRRANRSHPTPIRPGRRS